MERPVWIKCLIYGRIPRSLNLVVRQPETKVSVVKISASCDGSRSSRMSQDCFGSSLLLGALSWRLRSPPHGDDGGRVRRAASVNTRGAPARSSLYVAGIGGDVTSWPGRGIMAVEQERALGAGNRSDAPPRKNPFG